MEESETDGQWRYQTPNGDGEAPYATRSSKRAWPSLDQKNNTKYPHRYRTNLWETGMDKLLNQFLAVAEAGSISAAATNLFVTQPTLTFNMRKLEESLGVKLFIRGPRGVELTEYGETLYQNGRLMRRLYDNTLSALARQRGRIEEGLRIGSGYSWWTLFI